MSRIVDIRRETPLVKTFVLDCAIDAEPGQFILLWLPGVDEKPMSIAGMNPLTVSVARVGPMTIALHELHVGDVVGWRGPFGNPFRLEPERRALLVAGGYGSAPLYVLAQYALARGIDVTVAIGARVADELLYADKFEALGVPLLLSTNDGSRGVPGFVTDAIRQHFIEPLSHERTSSAASATDARSLHNVTVYACGPERMLVALHTLCRQYGWNGQLSVERYMKCGFGICGQCALDDILVCMDGPVLTLDQLDGKKDFGHWHRGPTGRRMPI
ncbi:MAG: dihydroorotate dehydrogenase electron transfer subunit [Anaerolineae bacterium]|nr:dihydroorotate dehydrogenase electron transfer subunit [Thermoflexales bacterium]MDW8406264.1 dihydroorotate dehydrogenase electron transfer subunit [Anaerolineae bacterium]